MTKFLYRWHREKYVFRERIYFVFFINKKDNIDKNRCMSHVLSSLECFAFSCHYFGALDVKDRQCDLCSEFVRCRLITKKMNS